MPEDSFFVIINGVKTLKEDLLADRHVFTRKDLQIANEWANEKHVDDGTRFIDTTWLPRPFIPFSNPDANNKP